MRVIVEVKKLKNPNDLECKNCPFSYQLNKEEYLCTVAEEENPLSKYICIRGFDPRTLKVAEVSEYMEYMDREIKETETWIKRRKKKED